MRTFGSLAFALRCLSVSAIAFLHANADSQTMAPGLFGGAPPEVVVHQGRASLTNEIGEETPCFLSIADRVAVTVGKAVKGSFDICGELLVWDLAEGRLAHRIELPARVAAITARRGEGRLVVAGGPVNKDFNPPYIAVINLRDGGIAMELPAVHESGRDLELRLARDGRSLLLREGSHFNPGTNQQETRYLAYALPEAGQSPSEARVIGEAAWNRLAPPAPNATAPAAGAPNWIRRVGDVDEGFALATDEHSTALWRTDTWEKVTGLGAFTPPWQDWSPSADGRLLVSWRAGIEGGLVVWDLRSFRVNSFAAPDFHPGITPAFSADNHFLRYTRLVPGSGRLLTLSRNLSSGREEVELSIPVKPFEHQFNATVQGRFSENGQHLVLVTGDGRTRVRLSWKESGLVSSTLKTPPAPIPVFVSDDGSTAGFAPDWTNVEGSESFPMFIVDLESGTILRRWEIKTAGHVPRFSGAIDDAGRVALSHYTAGASLGYYAGDAVVLSEERTSRIPGFDVDADQSPLERVGNAVSVGFAKPRGGGDRLATVYANNGRLVTFDPESGRIVLDYHWDDFNPFIEDPEKGVALATRVVAGEGGRAFLPIREGGIRVLDLLAEGRAVHRADLWSLPGSGWFAVTPQGHYACSVGSERHVFFRTGGEMHPFEQFDAQLNRPDLVATALGAEAAVVAALGRAHRRRLGTLGEMPGTVASPDLRETPELILQDGLPLTWDAEAIEIRFEARAPSGKRLRELEIFANGVRLDPGDSGNPAGRGETSGAFRADLAPGGNLIEARAIDESGARSFLRGARLHRGSGGTSPDLYVIAIGVSDYSDDRFDLTFAAKDARDLGQALRHVATGFGQVHHLEILDGNATRESILGANALLRNSRPADRIVIFAAGHGLLDQEYRYFFGTTDIDFENPSVRGLSYEALESLFEGVPARERLLLMDTCQAGSVDVALLKALEEGTVELPETITVKSNEGLRAAAAITPETRIEGQRFVEELFRDLRRGTGTTVISASRGLEFALESEDWKNGVFTYAFIDTIGNAASHDLDGDGILRVSELLSAVSRSVSAMTGGLQNPDARSVNLAADFPVLGLETARKLESPIEFLERYLATSSTTSGRTAPAVERIVACFAERAEYFGRAMTRREIADDIARYNLTYDERSYRLDGAPELVFSEGGEAVAIDFAMAFETGYFEEVAINVPGEGPGKAKARAYRKGTLRVRMKLRRSGSEWLIEFLGTR